MNWEFQKDYCFLTLSALRKDRQSSTDLQSEFAGQSRQKTDCAQTISLVLGLPFTIVLGSAKCALEPENVEECYVQ